VCRINCLQHINECSNNNGDKILQSLYYEISMEYKCRMWLNKMNHSARSMTKYLSRNTIATKTIIPDTRRMLWNAMDEMKNCCEYASSYDNCCKSGKFALVAIPLGNAWKQSQTMSPGLPHNPGDCPNLNWCIWSPDGSPWGKCAPSALKNRALVIPSSELTNVCLKLIALAYCEMRRKGFPGSDLMIAREPRMCPPKVSHSQCLENAPKMIPQSESDEEPGKRCTFPSSQLGRRGISELSLDGTSQSTEPPQKLHPHPE
jgi:hypothetical protein